MNTLETTNSSEVFGFRDSVRKKKSWMISIVSSVGNKIMKENKLAQDFHTYSTQSTAQPP